MVSLRTNGTYGDDDEGLLVSIKCASFVLFKLLPFWSYPTHFDIKQIARNTLFVCLSELLHTHCEHIVQSADQKLCKVPEMYQKV